MEKNGSRVTTGVILIVLGLIFLGERQHLVPAIDLGRLWPLILIILGLGRFLAKTEDGKHRGGIWLMFIGGLFLLHTFGIFTIHQSWPLFIVAGGLSILFGRRRGARGTGDTQ
jgi:hypothetical protein